MHQIFLVLPRNPICNAPGECSGSTLVGLTFPQNLKECLKDCKDNKECLYFTYHEDRKKYYLLLLRSSFANRKGLSNSFG